MSYLRLFYQTWLPRTLHKKNMAWVVNRLKTTHPDFKYNLFDDNDCRKIYQETF